MAHRDADLLRWARGATPETLAGLLAPTVIRMAFLLTGERHTRRADATTAILTHRDVPQRVAA